MLYMHLNRITKIIAYSIYCIHLKLFAEHRTQIYKINNAYIFKFNILCIYILILNELKNLQTKTYL